MVEMLYEMSNLTNRITKQPFTFWVDDIGNQRKVNHNNARYKVEANDIELDIKLFKDGTTEIVNENPRDIRKFKYSKEAVEFIQKFQKPLLMQWNQEIDVFQLADIIKLVQRQNYEIDDAIEIVMQEDY